MVVCNQRGCPAYLKGGCNIEETSMFGFVDPPLEMQEELCLNCPMQDNVMVAIEGAAGRILSTDRYINALAKVDFATQCVQRAHAGCIKFPGDLSELYLCAAQSFLTNATDFLLNTYINLARITKLKL